MLKGIDPILGPELLAILRAMGHGDELVIVDVNFPAESHAQRLIRMDGVDAVALLAAIVKLLPLDNFDLDAAFRMRVTGAPEQMPPVVAEFSRVLAAEGYARPIAAITRDLFLERVQRAYAVIATGERRLWGNIILVKGAIAPGS